jgi:hypothetical protein
LNRLQSSKSPALFSGFPGAQDSALQEEAGPDDKPEIVPAAVIVDFVKPDIPGE